MTNEEKLKTTKERIEAFDRFCNPGPSCITCPIHDGHSGHRSHCAFRWLALKAEERKLLPCPCCGGSPILRHTESGFYCVQCYDCTLTTRNYDTKEEAIAAWNRRVK